MFPIARLAGRGALRCFRYAAAWPQTAPPSASSRLTVVSALTMCNRTVEPIGPASIDQKHRLHPPFLALIGFAGLVALMAQPVWCNCMEDAAAAEADQPGYVVDAATRRKYGRYPPWCRLNVDQVPLPFVNDMDTTYETRGEKRVVINHLGPALSKRQATGQVCFRPMVPPAAGCTNSQAREMYDKYIQMQPAPCIIFRGQGNITDEERQAYPEGLAVLWQPKAWVDREVAKEWVEDVIEPFIEAERKAGVATTDTRYLLFQDNLDAQKTEGYVSLLKAANVDDHKLPPNETDQVQPIDRGLGRLIKQYIGQSMDEWLDDEDNATKWEENQLTAGDRRVLLANWYYHATVRALEGNTKLKYFQHAGALLTADGTDDDLIKLEGTPVGYKLKIPTPAPRAADD